MAEENLMEVKQSDGIMAGHETPPRVVNFLKVCKEGDRPKPKTFGI